MSAPTLFDPKEDVGALFMVRSAVIVALGDDHKTNIVVLAVVLTYQWKRVGCTH